MALADFLHLKTGIRVRETAMGDFCRRHGVRLYRPTYRNIRIAEVDAPLTRDARLGQDRERQPDGFPEVVRDGHLKEPRAEQEEEHRRSHQVALEEVHHVAAR